jgi:hypothetical protein
MKSRQANTKPPLEKLGIRPLPRRGGVVTNELIEQLEEDDLLASVQGVSLLSFFGGYRDAFNTLDGDAVAALWHTPSGIAQDGGVTWWADAQPMRDNMAALCELYRTAGFARTDFELKAAHKLGPQFAFADVQWTIWRADSTVLQRFGTAYQLIHIPPGWRVLLCTAYQEDLAAMREAPR